MAGSIQDLEIKFLETPFEGLRVRDNRQEKLLTAALGESGQESPIVVVAGPKAGAWIVIDGHRRVRALRSLGEDRVRAMVLAMEAPEALLWIRVDLSRRRLDAFEEALLIRELHQSQGLTLVTIARRFRRSRSWVGNRLDLVTVLPAEIQQRVIAGRIPVHSALKVLSVVARTNPDHACHLAKVIDQEQLSTRDIERIHRHYRRGSDDVRREILENPLRVLAAEQVIEDARMMGSDLDPREEDLVQELARVERRLGVLLARIREVTLSGLDPALARRIDPVWTSLRKQTSALDSLLNPTTNETGGNQDHDRREDKADDLRTTRQGSGDSPDREDTGAGVAGVGKARNSGGFRG